MGECKALVVSKQYTVNNDLFFLVSVDLIPRLWIYPTE